MVAKDECIEGRQNVLKHDLSCIPLKTINTTWFRSMITAAGRLLPVTECERQIDNK